MHREGNPIIKKVVTVTGTSKIPAIMEPLASLPHPLTVHKNTELFTKPFVILGMYRDDWDRKQRPISERKRAVGKLPRSFPVG